MTGKCVSIDVRWRLVLGELGAYNGFRGHIIIGAWGISEAFYKCPLRSGVFLRVQGAFTQLGPLPKCVAIDVRSANLCASPLTSDSAWS
jgi:hypothetical protein